MTGSLRLDLDDFELFDLPRRFAVEPALLDERWKALQAQVHPDRFAAQGTAAQRVAMQWAVRVNEAYQRLKHPLKRAAYLCELNGAPVQAESNTAMPADFLMQQMAWREALDEARDEDALDALAAQVRARRREMLEALRECIDERHDYAAAVQQVRALMFIERFAEEVDRRLDALGQQ